MQFLVLLGRSKGEAYRYILSQSGLPDREIAPRRTGQPLIPPEAIPLKELPDHEPARQLLIRRHVPQLIPISYVCASGYYKDRVVLPCLELDILRGSECKAIYKAENKSLFHPPGEFPRANTVYTTRVWNPNSKRLVVTESILDAETFSGIENACGTYGSELSEGQVVAILGLGAEEIVWALDGDAHDKVLKAFKKYGSDLWNNSIIQFGQKEDPNSVGPFECAKRLTNRKKIETEWDLMSLAIEWGKWCTGS